MDEQEFRAAYNLRKGDKPFLYYGETLKHLGRVHVYRIPPSSRQDEMAWEYLQKHQSKFEAAIIACVDTDRQTGEPRKGHTWWMATFNGDKDQFARSFEDAMESIYAEEQLVESGRMRSGRRS